MRAIIPAYREDPADVAHVARVCAQADLHPLLVLQDWIEPLPAGDWDTLLLSEPAGKGGAVKHALLAAGPTSEPFVVVDADLYLLEPERVAAAAELAAAGLYARPAFDGGAGRLGRRLAPIIEMLDALPPEPLTGLSRGGLLAPIAGYPNRKHAAASREDGMAWDLDVILSAMHDPAEDCAIFPGGQRVHRPGAHDHLTRALAAHLACLARWTRW